MTIPESQIDQILADESFHIEFHGYLSNHAKHVAIALDGLGAARKDIFAYVDDYAKTTYGFGLEASKPPSMIATEGNWRELLGKHEEFDALRRFFRAQMAACGLEETLQFYVPELLSGCVGALLHGTIHLGWALDAGHEDMVVEGLVYLAYSFVSCHPTHPVRDQGSSNKDQTPLASLQRVATAWSDNSRELESWVHETLQSAELSVAAGFQPVLEHTGAQLNIARVLARGHPLIESRPAWTQGEVTERTWKDLYYAISVLYMSNPGDFVLLHLITSLHAVEQIARHLPPEGQREAIGCYWKALLGILLALRAVPSSSRLAAIHSRYAGVVDPVDDESVRSDWSIITKRALRDREEHNPKLVYVARKLWTRFGGLAVHREAARHFTTTPVLSPDAAFSASSNPRSRTGDIGTDLALPWAEMGDDHAS